MYRAVGVLAAERGIDPDDAAALGRLVAGLDFELARDGERLLVGGRDLSAAIRRPDAGELASRISTHPAVRQRLVALQRALGAGGGVVMEGRDIGTVVFPDAPVKLYLTADPTARAARRAAELRARAETVDEAALARELAERDRRDAARALAAPAGRRRHRPRHPRAHARRGGGPHGAPGARARAGVRSKPGAALLRPARGPGASEQRSARSARAADGPPEELTARNVRFSRLNTPREGSM